MTWIENYIENLTFDNDWPLRHKTYIFTHLELCVTEVDKKYLHAYKLSWNLCESIKFITHFSFKFLCLREK